MDYVILFCEKVLKCNEKGEIKQKEQLEKKKKDN
jgi:hypothetical protein